MNIDPNSPAFPSTNTVTFEGNLCRIGDYDARIESVGGLPIRAHFAAMAMQGLLASPDTTDATPNTVAKDSVILADALLGALNKEGK